MKRRLFLPALALAANAQDSQSPRSFALIWRDNYRKHWTDERDYTLEVLEAMPPDGFEFRPNPVQRTFGDQIRHLAHVNSIYFRVFNLVTLPSPPLARETKLLDAVADPNDKNAVRRFTVASFDYCAEVLAKLSEEELLRSGYQLRSSHTGIDVLMRAYTHTAHHRGQAVAYLRARGLAPPAWKFEPA
ncbi:MAG: DinB family protein [Bryobacteraceae bacterium]